MSKTLKISLIIGAIIVIGALFFYFYQPNFTEDNLLVGVDGEVLENDPEGITEAENFFISQINQLQNISLDNINVLSSPEFMSLEDNTVELPELPVGRDNPFAPLGQLDIDSLIIESQTEFQIESTSEGQEGESENEQNGSLSL